MRCADLILHLHGLENEQHIAALNGLTCRAWCPAWALQRSRRLQALLRVLLPEPALPRVPALLQPVPVREPRRSVLRLPIPFLLLLQTACR